MSKTIYYRYWLNRKKNFFKLNKFNQPSKVYLTVGLQADFIKTLSNISPVLQIFLQGNRSKGKLLWLYFNTSINLITGEEPR